MANPIDQISPEKRILLAFGLCILVSILFSSLMAPPPTEQTPVTDESGAGLEEEPASLSAAASPTVVPESQVQKEPAPAEASPSETGDPTALGSLIQIDPPEGRQIVVDTPRARFVFSATGANLRSCRLKDYWEFDPPVQLLEAKIEAAFHPDVRAFWEARIEEIQDRKWLADGKEYRKNQPVPEPEWVELVPPYQDSAGYPLRLAFGNGATDEGLVYECDWESGEVELGPEDAREIRFTARTAAGVVLRKTVSFSGSEPDFKVTVEAEAPEGIDALRKAFKNQWSLEWPDGLQHLPFQYLRSQTPEANHLYALLDDSKDNTPTLRDWLVKQARSSSEPIVEKDYRHGLAGRVGWINVETRYFIASFLPQGPPVQGVLIAGKIFERPEFDTRVGMGVVCEFAEEPRTVKVYAGPKLTDVLAKLGGGLDRVVYDSWFGSVCMIVEKLLTFFYGIFPSYGLAIVLLCVFSKVILYPLSYKQAQTQKKMAALQPKIAELKEKYKDDKQRLSQEQMKLWKKHGVNPASGCLPMVAQIPIFIALYRTIQSSIDLRGAPFLWIHDLSLPDMTFFLPVSVIFIGNAVNVLPVIMTAISIIQMQQQKKMMPDPSQAKMMTIMTGAFFFILYNFSSGLVLYWTANSLTQWIQQKAMERLGHSAPRTTPQSDGTGESAGIGDDGKHTGATSASEPPVKKKFIPARRPKARRRKVVR